MWEGLTKCEAEAPWAEAPPFPTAQQIPAQDYNVDMVASAPPSK